MMKAAAFLGLLCALGFSGCAQQHYATMARRHAAVMESLPAAVKSLRVDIVPSTEHPVLAWATAGMMQQYIAYNPRVAEQLPPEVLAFALVHEYAHLKLNHVGPLGGHRPAATVREQELVADRFAAKFWATNDARVAEAAAASFTSPAGRRALGSEQKSLEAGYPTQKERAQVILDCLAQAQPSAAPKKP
jgi:Zn-dependent protease with chaperone function